MVSILLHKLELNEKRCLLNKSCHILCPNNGNISRVYGGSFDGYLQRDNCVPRTMPRTFDYHHSTSRQNTRCP